MILLEKKDVSEMFDSAVSQHLSCSLVRGHVSFRGCKSQFLNCHLILWAAERVRWDLLQSISAPEEPRVSGCTSRSYTHVS